MTEQLGDSLYTVRVPLPDNPLKWLNTYVITGGKGERSLLIDTGFKRPECLEALLGAFDSLGLDPHETDVFLTHVHSDHTGNAPELQRLGCRLIMGKTDHRVLLNDTWDIRKQRVLSEGMPKKVMDLVFEHNPAVKYAPGAFDALEVENGSFLTYGGYRLELIETPGHTPGHMCLYDAGSETMLSGDHVLFDITPNICFWSEMPDALGAYLDSLSRIGKYSVRSALPGHRNVGSKTFAERIDELQQHHAQRLDEAERVVHDFPGINAYDLAGKMTWRIRARGWDDFPPGQKWFAVGETLAHLDYLVLRGRIERLCGEDGTVTYK